MTKENRKVLVNVGYFILIFVFVAYIYLGNIQRETIMNSNRATQYTIGQIINYRTGVRISTSLVYNWTHGKDRYEGTYTPNYYKDIANKKGEYNYYKGRYYLVKFSKKKPKFNELLWDKPVPDSLVQCCRKQVWDEPPF